MPEDLPLQPGDFGTVAMLSLCAGGLLRTWTDTGSRLWTVHDADLLREIQGTGTISRTLRGAGRFREVGLLFEKTGTLILQSRFPTKDDGDHLQFDSHVFSLGPAGDVAESTYDEVRSLLSQAIRNALSNNEFLLVELGGWDAPFEPYCLFILTEEDDAVVSMIETVPDPRGSRLWEPHIVEGRQTQNLSAPASAETIDVAPILMMDAIGTWGLQPWDLALTFGTAVDIGSAPISPHDDDEAVAGGDVRRLGSDLTAFAGGRPTPLTRPELRRAPRAEVAVYRLRADLDHAEPPIWRRIDLRSDLPLDVVHQVLQVAFDWTDSHLHRFSLGGGPFDERSQLFLCPYDVQECEPEDDGGIPAAEVRLDETVQEPGDVLRYLYDYGDTWELTIRLEEILPARADSPTATVMDGRRTAPPEDCGGLTDAESLAEVLDDPARFDLEEINQALRGPYFILTEYGVDGRLVDLVHRLHYTRVGRELGDRMIRLISEPTMPDEAELAACLRAHRWFLDRAADGGIALTAAGYLKPADVEAASEVVAGMDDWFGAKNREVHCAPLLHFRRTLQSMGLLRKHKNTLVLTRAGAAAQRDPAKLWEHLAARLVPGMPDTFECQATLLFLAYAASSINAAPPLDEIATALTELGWRHPDGPPVRGSLLYRLSAHDVLTNVTDRPASWDERRISAAAAALARAALRRRKD
ncbi:MAG: plasmid pRiA4b ORF-3 family protein [Mycobacterium sp.]